MFAKEHLLIRNMTVTTGADCNTRYGGCRDEYIRAETTCLHLRLSPGYSFGYTSANGICVPEQSEMTTPSEPGLFKRLRAQVFLRSARIHRHYGIVHSDKNEFLSAVEHYGKAIKLNPTLGTALLERGTLEWREL